MDTTDTAATVAAAELIALGATVHADEPAYLADLERLVNIDCGSYTPEGVDRFRRDQRPPCDQRTAMTTAA